MRWYDPMSPCDYVELQASTFATTDRPLMAADDHLYASQGDDTIRWSIHDRAGEEVSWRELDVLPPTVQQHKIRLGVVTPTSTGSPCVCFA